MTALVTRQVRQHFNAHADDYDGNALVQKRVVSDLLARLPAQLDSFEVALDLGSGTGDLACQLAQRAPHLTVIVADLAHAMTATALRRVAGLHGVDADAEALPLRAGCVDLVLSASMYQWVNDLDRAFAEVRRVLKPGGLFAFALFGAGTLRELRAAHAAAVAEAGGGSASHMQTFPDRARVASALAQAGLRAELSCRDEVEEHPDVPDLLRKLKRIGAQNAAENRPAGLGGRRTTQRMMALYTEQYGTAGSIPATYEVICGLARV